MATMLDELYEANDRERKLADSNARMRDVLEATADALADAIGNCNDGATSYWIEDQYKILEIARKAIAEGGER